MSDDPFRYCIYCNADCYEDEPEHAADCPSTTGVYPVRAEDRRPCPHCGKPTIPATVCMDCGSALEDFYMRREVDPGDHPSLSGVAGAAIFEVICIGCAAKEQL